MKPCLRIWLLLLIVLGTPAGSQAQNLESSSINRKDPDAAVVEKPKRKLDRVITNDSIALLAVRHPPPAIVAPSEDSAKRAASGTTLDDPSKKEAEIASLERQIKDKQQRIALLLRLFVSDEKAFVIDPLSTNVDAAVAERRRYEQDELRWETAEVAKLKSRLGELTGKGEGQ